MCIGHSEMKAQHIQGTFCSSSCFSSSADSAAVGAVSDAAAATDDDDDICTITHQSVNPLKSSVYSTIRQ